jgi:peptidyl-prolyl cis-trans isomerase SurA
LLILAASQPAGNAFGQVLDRVAASVGNTAITERDVTMECRFESFLEGRMPAREYDSEARTAALNRLISQVLLQRQLQAAPEKASSGAETAGDVLQQTRERFSSEAEYEAAVRQLGMSEKQITERIETYQRTLRVIEQRFEAPAAPTAEQIGKYYRETFQPEYQRLHAGTAPALSGVEPEIRQILIQQNINQLLHDWLEEMRGTEHVRIREP